jgi:hypothetical protein
VAGKNARRVQSQQKGSQQAIVKPGNVDVVNQAIKRLDDAVLTLNLSQIGKLPP